MTPDVDDSEWPLVRITYQPDPTFEDLDVFRDRVGRVFESRGPMVTLVDISRLNLMTTTPMHRRRVAEEADNLAARGAFIAEAVIIINPVLRVLYMGYSWARQRNNHPSATFADEKSAYAWAVSHLPAAQPVGGPRRP